jgi:hypothetical protein
VGTGSLGAALLPVIHRAVLFFFVFLYC